jgi:N-acetylneuraminate synthase
MTLKIIAEIGINHNGDLDTCKKLIDVAVDAGCDAVKFQKRTIEKVYSPELLSEPRESPWGTTQREQKEGLEFGIEEYSIIDSYCRNVGIDWFASAWDLDSQDFLRQFNCKYNKIASAMLTYTPLLKKVAEEKKHTFISTGMSSMNDVAIAVQIFRGANCPFELMHTVSTYPMSAGDANLRMIQTLKDKFSCNVGYSGHEVGLSISLGAVALGISSLERHITLDRSMYGSDQSASVEPAGLRQLVGGARKIVNAMGTGIKTITDGERLVASKLRAHLG